MMRSQYLCSRGFLVFVLDNRGGARRGLAFEAVIKNDMGHLEVEDQVDGVQWLVNQGLADARRVGINGGSYGGYMAAMCLARAPGFQSCGRYGVGHTLGWIRDSLHRTVYGNAPNQPTRLREQ